MYSNLPQDQQNLFWDYLHTFNRRKWLILIPTFLGFTAAITLIYLLPKEYRSTTMILVEEQRVPQEYVRSTVTSSIEKRLKTISQQVLSRTNLIKLIDYFDYYSEHKRKLTREEMVNDFRNRIDSKIVGTSAFSLSFSGKDPAMVMNMTNALASGFIEENLKLREQQAEVTTQFLQNELSGARKRLEELDKDLKRFKEKNMGGLPGQLDANLRVLGQIQTNLIAINEQIDGAKNNSRSIEQTMAELEKEKFMFSSLDFDVNSELAEPGSKRSPIFEIERLKRQLENLRSIYKENFPDVVNLRGQIKRLEAQSLKEGNEADELFDNRLIQVRKELQQTRIEINSLEGKRVRLAARIADYNKRIENTPNVETQFKNLMRGYDIAQKNYQSLLQKTFDARISENLERHQKGERFRILDSANFPEKPYKPIVWKVMLIGLLGGLGTGVGLVLLVEFLNPCFRRPEDLDGVIQAPLILTISDFSLNERKRKYLPNLRFINRKKGKHQQKQENL